MASESEKKPLEKDDDQFILIKRSICPGCGSPKLTPSRNQYIYCDFCATLMDVDYKNFQPTSYVPGDDPEYDSFVNTFSREVIKAKNAGDKEQYAKLYRRYTELQIEKYPQSYPARMGDDEYRKKYIDYSGATAAENAFDPYIVSLTDQMSQYASKISYKSVEVDGKPKNIMKLNELRKLYKACLTVARAATAHFKRIGLEPPNNQRLRKLPSRCQN